MQCAIELEGDVKATIFSSRPAGRTYKTTAITRRLKNNPNKLKRRGDRLIIGYNFHRASAEGQAPAIRTGGLINSIRAQKIAELRARVIVGKDYGAILDDPRGLNRPFFQKTLKKRLPVYLARIRREIRKQT